MVLIDEAIKAEAQSMDKKLKHITVNLTENEYNYICDLSNKLKRNIANTVYIIISDYIDRYPYIEK